MLKPRFVTRPRRWVACGKKAIYAGMEQVTEWLYEEGFRGFLGEFGGSTDATCLAAMDNLLAHLGDNADVWLGWTVWAATDWGIQHNVRPVNGNDSDQMKVLLRHMDR
jgi:endoglucanase